METFEIPILELGVSQLYLNQRKLETVRQQMLAEDFAGFSPLPVYDFGDGKPVLTDGHSRAFVAWQKGMKTLTVAWDTDPNVTSKLSQRLYRTDLEWCAAAGIRSIADLESRILQPASYEFYWLERCRRSYTLLTTRNQQALEKAKALAPDMTLYGAERNLLTFYFEDAQKKLFKYYDGELKQERAEG